jgi:hypothetical protein
LDGGTDFWVAPTWLEFNTLGAGQWIFEIDKFKVVNLGRPKDISFYIW